MQSSSIIPTSPAFQNNALVGHAFMQSLHSTPWHVFLLIAMLPSVKNSFRFGDLGSSDFFLFFFSLASVRSWNISGLVGVLVFLGIYFIFKLILSLGRIIIVDYNYLSKICIKKGQMFWFDEEVYNFA